MDSFIKFIQSHYDVVNYTHVIDINGKNAPIRVDDKELNQFLTSAVSSQFKVKERFQSEWPVMIQVEKTGVISDKQKVRIAASLQFAVTNSFILDEEYLSTTFFHETGDQITVVMPHCKVPYQILRKEIREAVIYILDQKKVLTDQGHSSIVTKDIYNNDFWINRPLDEISVLPIITPENVETVTPVSYHAAFEEKILDETKFQDNQLGLTQLLSVSGYARDTIERNLQSTQLRKTQSNNELVAERMKEKIKSDTEICIDIKQFIDKTRCMTLSGFLEVGQCIFNITAGDKKGIQIWQSLAPSEHVQDTEKYWPFFKITNTSIGTFRYWCFQDDPEGFKKWQEDNLLNNIWMCLNPTAGHSDIANVMYKMYQDRFVCASVKDQLWYEFKGHRFEELDGGVTLRRLLSTEVAEKFEAILNDCNVNCSKAPPGVEKEKWKAKEELCLSIIRGLKSSNYKSNIMREATEIFFDPSFIKLMNSNKTLFATENGVIDLERVSVETALETWIRPGRPEDRITISCGYAFKNFSWDDPDVIFCLEYLNKVYVDEDIRNYNKRVVASCLEGGNKEKIVPIWTGMGNNSKSVFEMICEKIFGDYCAKPPSSLITAKERTSPGSATPEYEVLKYARIAFCQEPKSGSTLNDSTLKELSSGYDTMYSRALNKMPTKIVPQFTLFIVCNNIPKTDGSDIAVINRLRIVEHLSTFSRQAPTDEKEQWEKKVFPIDLDFEKKVPKMIQPMLWILLQEYALYKKEGLKTPEVVTKATQLYKESNDKFSQFLDEKFEKVDKDQAKIVFVRLEQAYGAYKAWFLEACPNEKAQGKQEFKDQMRRYGLEANNLRFFGIKLRAQ